MWSERGDWEGSQGWKTAAEVRGIESSSLGGVCVQDRWAGQESDHPTQQDPSFLPRTPSWDEGQEEHRGMVVLAH